MKKMMICLVAGISLLCHSDVFAAPSNGPRLPGKGHAEWGYEYNALFKRSLSSDYGEMRSQNHFYTLSLGIFDWLSIDGKIGFGDITRTGGTHLRRQDFNTEFAGGYGFRIMFLDDRKYWVRLVGGFQHVCVHPQARSVDNDKFVSILDDWQGSALISKKLEIIETVSIEPYIGMKGSDCEFIYELNKQDRKRRFSKYHIGLIAGLDAYFLGEKVRAGVEGRFFDEYAFSTSITYLF